MYIVQYLQCSCSYCTPLSDSVTVIKAYNVERFVCFSFYPELWSEHFPPSLHTHYVSGIVKYPISLIHMDYYSLMTSLTQGSSWLRRAVDESVLSIQPGRKEQARRGGLNLSLYLSHQIWFNMDTDDWLNTARLLTVKVMNPVLVVVKDLTKMTGSTVIAGFLFTEKEHCSS